jgi:uncharacterized membrane protein
VFLFGKKKELFNEEDKQLIIEAVRNAEKRTSGEIRVFVESRCRYVDAMDRAADIFFGLKMENTANRNAVLIYVAIKDRQLAVLGDEGIHQKLGQEYWEAEVKKLINNFNKDDFAEGIRQCVTAIGEALYYHFPYDKQTDKNELPDDIVFGK